jgi:uncharacterized protein (DUF2141 family)
MGRMLRGLMILLALAIRSAAANVPAAADGVAPKAAASTTLVVIVTALRTDRGLVKVTLHASAATFPGKGEPLAVKTAAIDHGRAQIEFPDLVPGDYAFAVMHDEDGDGSMDRNWVGLPSEGWAFSHDAKPSFGPPTWDDAKVAVSGARIESSVAIRY